MTPRHAQLARLSGGLPSNLWLLSSRVEAGNLPQWRGPCPVGRRILDIGTLLSRSTLALIDELMFTLQRRVARHAPRGSAPRATREVVFSRSPKSVRGSGPPRRRPERAFRRAVAGSAPCGHSDVADRQTSRRSTRPYPTPATTCHRVDRHPRRRMSQSLALLV